MTASEDGSPLVASEAGDASMLRMTAVGTGRQDSGPVSLSLFRVWGRVLRAFDSMLVQPLKTWRRLEREISELRGMDYRELRDIGINRRKSWMAGPSQAKPGRDGARPRPDRRS